MKIFFVYLLLRKNGDVFYVGKSYRSDKRRYDHRLREHISLANQGKRGKKYNILRKELNNISIVPIFESKHEDAALDAEKIVITYYVGLSNLTAGGDGITGYSHTVKTRKYISKIHTGKKRAPEVGQKIAASLRGQSFSQERKNNISRAKIGAVASKATKRKMSEAQTGRKRAEWEIVKTAGENSGMAKANYAIVAEIKALRKEGLTYKQIVNKLTVKLSIATVAKIANGQLWKREV